MVFMRMRSLATREIPFDAQDAIDLLESPRRFDAASFESYLPDPNYPSQALAKAAAKNFAEGIFNAPRSEHGLWRRNWRFANGSNSGGKGIYLDGGFGVGKTHLLAAVHRVAPGPKAYCSFSDLVNFVGAIGFEDSVARLSGCTLIAIDEFELDDPGDTVLISTLLGRLANSGVNLAATSNTLPDKLGQGRFAAADFRREIQGLAARFSVLSIEGGDYRHISLRLDDQDGDLSELLNESENMGDRVSLDSFAELNAKLATIHPVMYSSLLRAVDLAIIVDVRPYDVLSEALRFVSLVDRAYELGVAIFLDPVRLGELFPESFLSGGYRTKFGRCLSRLSELRQEALEAIRSQKL